MPVNRRVEEAQQRRRFNKTLGCVFIACAVLLAMIELQNAALAKYFPHLERVATDFSPAYLHRELDFMATEPPQTIFLGDSVVWGYDLAPQQTAVSIMTSRGCACRNLTFKSSSPPNYYSLALLLQNARIHPKIVVLEVNQKVLNAADTSYQTLHPAIATLARALLAPAERAKLLPLQDDGQTFAQRLDRGISSLWNLYAMRSDIRETLLGEVQAIGSRKPAVASLAGTYDLSPLDENNVGVHFLGETVKRFHASGVPVIAFMTPTNHRLLHEYIDSPEYRSNGSFLARTLTKYGAHIVDLDAAFSPDDFLDYDHLTPRGQKRLASVLLRRLSNAEASCECYRTASRHQ